MSIRGRVNPINNIIAQRNVGPQDKITRKYAAKTRQFIKGPTKKGCCYCGPTTKVGPEGWILYFIILNTKTN